MRFKRRKAITSLRQRLDISLSFERSSDKHGYFACERHSLPIAPSSGLPKKYQITFAYRTNPFHPPLPKEFLPVTQMVPHGLSPSPSCRPYSLFPAPVVWTERQSFSDLTISRSIDHRRLFLGRVDINDIPVPVQSAGSVRRHSAAANRGRSDVNRGKPATGTFFGGMILIILYKL